MFLFFRLRHSLEASLHPLQLESLKGLQLLSMRMLEQWGNSQTAVFDTGY